MKKTVKPVKKASTSAKAAKAPAKKAASQKTAAKSKSVKVDKTKPVANKADLKAKESSKKELKVSAKTVKELKKPVKQENKISDKKADKNTKGSVKEQKDNKVPLTGKNTSKTPLTSKKEIKKGKKSKAADGEEGFEEVDLEQLLKDAVPVVKKKPKVPQKQKPVEIDEYEEFKRPTFNAKSLTQAIAGPPSAPPKAEPVSKVKGKYLKFELEFLVRSSVKLLYEFLSTPSGLSEWFADDVNFRNDIYSFIWDKAEQKAKLVKAIENKSVRFQWIDENKEIYFEFRIEVDDLTGDVALIITDFAEDDLSKDTAVLLWNSQIDSLLKAIGSY